MIRCAWRGGGLGSAVLNITMQVLARIRERQSTIHSALYAGNVALVLDYLIVDPACVNKRADRDRTPLQAAASEGHLDIVRLLVCAGAYVYACC